MARRNAVSREKGEELGCSLGEGGVKLEREKGEKKNLPLAIIMVVIIIMTMAYG